MPLSRVSLSLCCLCTAAASSRPLRFRGGSAAALTNASALNATGEALDLNDAHDNATANATTCVEINQCVGCTRQFFTKSFLGDDAAVLARSSGEERASPRHRAGVASMVWRRTRQFNTKAP